MKKQWYFGILVSALALLVIVKEQSVVPNQEVVLQFEDVGVTSQEAQQAITNVKKQLESIGVEYTIVSKELEDGKLKIAYYSDADVEFIKRILSKTQNVALDHILYDQTGDGNQDPSHDASKDYSLSVYEIQTSLDADSDFNGVCITEIKQGQEGYFKYNSSGLFTQSNNDVNRCSDITQKINTNIAVAIDHTSYTIPEVRAGPIS